MLLDEQYKAPPAIAPSVKGFKQWLERQPREGKFEYFDCENCAVGQYLKSLGRTIVDSSRHFVRLNIFANCAFWDKTSTGPITYADVLAEIEKAGI